LKKLLVLILIGLLSLTWGGYGSDDELIEESEVGQENDLAVYLAKNEEVVIKGNTNTPTIESITGIEEEDLLAAIDTMQDELEIRLHEMVKQTSGIVGLSYYCLVTDRHIEVNANGRFFAASTIKLPTHMIVAELVRDGRLSWDQQLTFTSKDFRDGSGILKHSIQPGHTFTVAELMIYSIAYSDNIAHWLLFHTFSDRQQLTRSIFNRYLPGEPVVGRLIMTPNQLTKIFRVLYRDKDQIEGYSMILEHMMNTSWTNRFATEVADGCVAHTPGWTDPYSHDSGIFFTEHPYILVVMTSGVPAAPDFLSEVSDMVFELHHQ